MTNDFPPLEPPIRQYSHNMNLLNKKNGDVRLVPASFTSAQQFFIIGK